MGRITALGEILIDFTPSGLSPQGNERYERNPGGAPANVLAALAKFGHDPAFLGKVGNDAFGTFLRETLERNRIRTEGLIVSREANTTLAFVHLAEGGERSFSFYRKPGADQLLSRGEIPAHLVQQADVFHFGSISLTDEPAREATLHAKALAKVAGVTVSYDPNYRAPLWNDQETAKRMMLTGLEGADVVKVSEEELELLTGVADLERGSYRLAELGGGTLVLVTLGPGGSFYRRGDETGRVGGFKVHAVDTTGAGDAFFGGFLHKLLELAGGKPERLEPEQLQEALRFANASGALTCGGLGAIPSLPSLEDVQVLMSEQA